MPLKPLSCPLHLSPLPGWGGPTDRRAFVFTECRAAGPFVASGFTMTEQRFSDMTGWNLKEPRWRAGGGGMSTGRRIRTKTAAKSKSWCFRFSAQRLENFLDFEDFQLPESQRCKRRQRWWLSLYKLQRQIVQHTHDCLLLTGKDQRVPRPLAEVWHHTSQTHSKYDCVTDTKGTLTILQVLLFKTGLKEVLGHLVRGWANHFGHRELIQRETPWCLTYTPAWARRRRRKLDWSWTRTRTLCTRTSSRYTAAPHTWVRSDKPQVMLYLQVTSTTLLHQSHRRRDQLVTPSNHWLLGKSFPQPAPSSCTRLLCSCCTQNLPIALVASSLRHTLWRVNNARWLVGECLQTRCM